MMHICDVINSGVFQCIFPFVLLYILIAFVKWKTKKGAFLHTLAFSLLRVPIIYMAIAMVVGLVWMITEVVNVMGLA